MSNSLRKESSYESIRKKTSEGSVEEEGKRYDLYKYAKSYNIGRIVLAILLVAFLIAAHIWHF
ncbi:MAG: hypothetical protein ACLTAQ_10620 [Longicatena caecimuris]|uniref:hypothetical protein n=1 Tax=Longicatena caecimuris TaxID=1796635 RepID=UPI0039947674